MIYCTKCIKIMAVTVHWIVIQWTVYHCQFHSDKYLFTYSCFLEESCNAFSWYNRSADFICPLFTSSTACVNLANHKMLAYIVSLLLMLIFETLLYTCQKKKVVAWSSFVKLISLLMLNSHFRRDMQVEVAVL